MKAFLKEVVEKSHTGLGRVFDLFIQALIVISLITFSVETLPDLSVGARHFLGWIEVIVVVVFTIEYILRLYVADHKLKFIFSFYGMIDLLAILPFYAARGVDLRSIRVFRLMRLIRIFKLLRFGRAAQRLKNAFQSIKTELSLFFLMSVFVLYVSSVGIYYFENGAQPEKFASVFHALWWSVATLTTVGYGDIYPITLGGKLFTFVVLMVGIGMVAVPTGLISSALTDAKHIPDVE